MDRVFLDANVLFSAAYSPDSRLNLLWGLKRASHSSPSKSSDRTVSPILVSSRYAVEEARRNLTSAPQRARLTRLLQTVQVIDAPYHTDEAPLDRATQSGAGAKPPLFDLPEKDRPILEAAIQSGATHLLTGDSKHFGALYGKRVEGVLILPPASYLLQ